MNRRGFLKAFGKGIGVGVIGLVAPKILLAEPKSDSLSTGYKGSVYMESGYFYAPYIPLQISGVMEGVDKTPIQFNTRYNK